MRSLERHRDAGAYALGVLDTADRFRFEDHLVECAACARYVGEVRPATQLLGVYARATPPHVDLFARPPAPALVDRAVDRLGVLHRAARRRWWGAGVAVALLLAIAGQGAAMLSGAGTGDAADLTLRGRDARSGVAATLTADARAWGTDVGLDVRDPGGPRVCELVAVGRDGSEQPVATWSVDGGREGRVSIDGGAAARPGEIARFEVRAVGGQRLLTLPVR
ncbi:zf-HC2 domain-containing protein [Streptomyces sp. NPDC052225]|uniref:zf-HC2 domain-containing protein n=1 Tax=Streptomyces sp. NPDC052225 TaxID=3154949 RepID=UPI003420D20B